MAENNITNYREFYEAQGKVKIYFNQIKEIESQISELEKARHNLYVFINDIQEAEDKFLSDMWEKRHGSKQ